MSTSYPQTPVHALTTRAPQRARVLKNDIFVTEAADPPSDPRLATTSYIAVWDTGATSTVISKKVVEDLGLIPSGRVTLHGVGSGDTAHEIEAPTYLINLILPNKVIVQGVVVAEASVSGCDVLLGMDVIGIGDFAISNHTDGTTWSFRAPSCGEIDFLPQTNRHNEQLHQQSAGSQDQRRRSRNKNKAARRKGRSRPGR